MQYARQKLALYAVCEGALRNSVRGALHSSILQICCVPWTCWMAVDNHMQAGLLCHAVL